MIRQYFFWALLFATCGYALWRGRRDERVVAGACLLASLATHFVVPPLKARYVSVDPGLLTIDGVMLAAFVTIALQSQRFWPLWVAGLQLTNSMSHLMKAIDLDLIPKAYAAAAAFWSYPILIILAVGTWRSHRRLMAQQGRAAPA